jgi:predicted DNA-binding transcriptional regulator AlpA
LFARPAIREGVMDVTAPQTAKSDTASASLIFKNELLRLLGVSYGSIFAWMREGKFPLAREIGPGGRTTKIAWVRAEVEAWLAARPQRQLRPPPQGAPRRKRHQTSK